MKEIWYAYMNDADDQWDWGTHDKEEAIDALMEGLCKEVAIIDVEDAFCLGAIRIDEDGYIEEHK